MIDPTTVCTGQAASHSPDAVFLRLLKLRMRFLRQSASLLFHLVPLPACMHGLQAAVQVQGRGQAEDESHNIVPDILVQSASRKHGTLGAEDLLCSFSASAITSSLVPSFLLFEMEGLLRFTL
jgi:hypothetical protein